MAGSTSRSARQLLVTTRARHRCSSASMTLAVPTIDLRLGPAGRPAAHHRVAPCCCSLLVIARLLGLVGVIQRNEPSARHDATHDSLTGLANRHLFAERRGEPVRSAAAGIVSVLFIDLDDFKTVNDSLGHAVGDELLSAVAERLQPGASRPTTAGPARWRRVRRAVEERRDEVGPGRPRRRVLNDLRRPFRIDGRESGSPPASASPPSTTRAEAEVLLRNADMAMYLAKERGKDRVELFEAHMHASAFERLELKADLVRGIDGPAPLDYQPIVSLADRPHHRRRGPRPLGPPHPWPPVPRRLHPPRRGHRPHRPARPLGAGGGVPAAPGLAARPPPTGHHVDEHQPLGAPARARDDRRGGRRRRSPASASTRRRITLEITETMLLTKTSKTLSTCQGDGVRYRYGRF